MSYANPVTSRLSPRVAVDDTWIGWPFSCAPDLSIAVKSSFRDGSKTIPNMQCPRYSNPIETQ